MSNNPLISIIIPAYQAELYLGSCLESLIAQTYRNIEIIIIDDGSTDRTPIICDQWAAKDRRIKVCHTPNGGVSRARNTGLSLAHGEYLMFVDSDDLMDHQAVEKAFSLMDEEKTDIVIFGKNYIDNTGNIIRKATIEQNLHCDEKSYYNQLAYLLDKDYLSSPWGKLYKKTVIGSTAFNTKMVYEEDLDFNLQVLSSRPQVLALNIPLYLYRHMDTGLATVYSKTKVANVISANITKINFFSRKLDKTGAQFLCHHIANDVGWVIPQIAAAIHIPVSTRIADIMEITGCNTYRSQLIHGLPHAGLTRMLKLFMFLNIRFTWKLYVISKGQ